MKSSIQRFHLEVQIISNTGCFLSLNFISFCEVLSSCLCCLMVPFHKTSVRILPTLKLKSNVTLIYYRLGTIDVNLQNTRRICCSSRNIQKKKRFLVLANVHKLNFTFEMLVSYGLRIYFPYVHVLEVS